jgi:hypothetical protein
MSDGQSANIPMFIRRLMPDANDAELHEAATDFNEYMEIVWQIFQRIKCEEGNDDSPKVGVRDRFEDNDQSI